MTGTWTAEFEKRHPGGPVVRATLHGATGTFSVQALFGPSGSGKTTVLRCLSGLDRPEAGRIVFDGRTWFDAATAVSLPPQQRDVGFLFQDYALFPHLTVAGNVGFGLLDQPPGERAERVHDVLRALGLDGLDRRRPLELSGGQQQRVALARAVARRPRLLLLDEPLAALDAPARAILRRELRHFLAPFRIPVIVVTHDPADAMVLADTIVVLDQGRVVQTGPVEEVFTHPATLSAARIVGVETVLSGRVMHVEQGLASVRVRDVDLLAVATEPGLGDVHVCIGAEAVTLQREVTRSSARNQLAGHVTSIVAEGPVLRVGVACGIDLTALVTRPALEELGLREGVPVTAVLKASAIHLISRD